MKASSGDVGPVHDIDFDNEHHSNDAQGVVDPSQQKVNDDNDLDHAERGDDDGDEKTQKKYRQWLLDRIFGKSPPPESLPPCWICYVPPCISV